MSSPLLGYNTNVRHKGKLYHIQTEDSGLQHPHIITHLFADGGRIIASKKTSYAEHIGTEDFKATVKNLMREQHKAMFIALRDGVYDEDEDQEDATAQSPPEQERRADPEPPSGEQPVDVDALERAAQDLSRSSPASAPAAEEVPASAASSGEAPDEPAASMQRRSRLTPAGAGRYQSTRPASEATSSRSASEATSESASRSESIFGNDLVTEKSLDEVILSYLAEDLEDSSDEGGG